MTLDDIGKAELPVKVMVTDEQRLISYDGTDFNFLLVTELYEDDDWVQRAITDNDRIVHIVDTFVVANKATLAYKELAHKAGCFALALRLNEVIANELSRREKEKRGTKRWLDRVQSEVRQLFIYDFDLLDEVLADPDWFIKNNILA
ncbi:MAG: hypothetical protein GY833_12500 [Aestuariibacter sp.]|nr:hypothetical protein [Aestuariibacter sp.]